jgi:CDP-glucose 4,6-dehydratase
VALGRSSMEGMDMTSFWQDRPVAVTGAYGFVGAHLTKQLIGLGANVVVLERDEVPETPIVADWAGRAAVVRGELQDQALMERILGEFEVVTLFHLAAQTQVRVSNRNAPSTFDSNIRGTWTLLEAAKRSPLIEQVVVASSDKAYGEQPVLPYTEDMPILAVHPYDVSKAAADLIAMSYAHTFGLPVSLSRCGNFFGPGDTNWDRLIPGTIRSLIRGERPVIRSDGTPTRDYVHVHDGALAYLRIAECMATDPATVGQIFNFSLESPMSVIDFVKLVQRAAGREDLEPEILGTATNEIQDQFLSSKKAREMLAWKPEMTVEEAVTETVDWYRSYLAGHPT